MVPQRNLDLIQEEARRVQKLARELGAARSANEARKIRREMARLSKKIEKASRAADDHDKAMSATG